MAAASATAGGDRGSLPLPRWVVIVSGRRGAGKDFLAAAIAAEAAAQQQAAAAAAAAAAATAAETAHAAGAANAAANPAVCCPTTGDSSSGGGSSSAGVPPAPVVVEVSVRSISEATKRRYAAATGADVGLLLGEGAAARAYKEGHRARLLAFHEAQVGGWVGGWLAGWVGGTGRYPYPS